MVFKTKGLNEFTKIMKGDREVKRTETRTLQNEEVRKRNQQRQCERANDEEGGILKQSDVLNHTLGKVLKLIMN